MTEKLFYYDSHSQEFEATVVSCEPAGDLFKIVLDKTVFFPEGGGQYADTGVLGNVNVLDVHEKNDVIYHTTDVPLTVGSKVTGKINWEERFEKMQQHTGEHIVSGIVNERFGYQNVGFHLSGDYCTMDFSGPITKEQLKEIDEHRKSILEKYRNTKAITRNELAWASNSYKNLNQQQIFDILIRFGESAMRWANGMDFNKEATFFSLTSFPGVIIDYQDVFAIGLVSNVKVNKYKTGTDTVVCVLFTNDPYVPAFPLWYC